MIRACFVALFLVTWCPLASAKLSYGNGRLDYALWPEHDPCLVVVGEIVPTAGKDAVPVAFPGGRSGFGFRVRAVVLGNPALQGNVIPVIADAFDWPTDLVSNRPGTHCLLVLRRWVEMGVESHMVSVVVPARDGKFPVVKDNVAARAVAAAAVVAALKVEKDAIRQRAMLLQLAPVIRKDDIAVVEGFLKSPDPWVRRAAIAGLVYTTEDPKYLEIAARDIQDYSKGTKAEELVEGHGSPGSLWTRTGWLVMYYFFLDKAGRTFGTRWCEADSDKSVRILRAMQESGMLDADVCKRIQEM